MGRFEDLIERAREGDTEALDALQTEFSGSTLRQQAEQADAFKARYESVLPFARGARLKELVSKLPEELQSVPLDVGDFGDFDPEGLTLEQVQDKAKAALEDAQASELRHAQAAGFDSVEDYQAALEAGKQQLTNRRTGMEAIAGAVASSGGEPAGSLEPSDSDLAKETFAAAKKSGETDDVALGRSIDAILTSQAERLGLSEA